MTSTARKKWGLVALAVGAVAVSVGLLGRFGGKQRTRFVYASGALDTRLYEALAAAPGWAASQVDVAPGVRINGLLRRPAGASAPWLFFLSGNDATPLSTAKSFLERVRGEADWGIAVYAYRGYDSSGGTPERDTIAADTARVFADLRARQHLSAERVHVVAFSLGAYFAAKLAGEAQASGQKLASLSLLAPAESIVMVRPAWSTWLERLAPGDVIDMQPLLDAVPAPVLVVQGDADTTTGVVQGRAVAERLGKRAEYVELPGVTHAALMETTAAVDAVRRMVERSR